MNPEEERILIKKAQAGDQQALSSLWDAITPTLFGYLVNTLRDRALSEDILQTTWLQAINALADFKYRGIGFTAWLFAIARNECRQHWRRRKGEILFDPTEHDQVDTNTGREKLENKILINQALSLLSEDDKELLRLRYIADLSIRDIALILKINSVTVRVRIHRTLARLRTLIAPPHTL